MYHKYRIIQRQKNPSDLAPQYVYILQTDSPAGHGWLNQQIGYRSEPVWYTVSTHDGLEAAQNAKNLIEFGLQPGDKIVG